ncbi:MAG: OmpA family protein [Alphaproteobacteria bacterium]|jgi:flagellar motor protein MotB|nr:OmpA family protein [Alphaproteobacteria bacterium]MDP7223159.1 OmpA family protein [Alphaproteobacteria bacterium]
MTESDKQAPKKNNAPGTDDAESTAAEDNATQDSSTAHPSHTNNAAYYETDFEQLFAQDNDNDINENTAGDWLLSYTDIATLLVTLFVALLAHSTFNMADETQSKPSDDPSVHQIAETDKQPTDVSPDAPIGQDRQIAGQGILFQDSINRRQQDTAERNVIRPDDNPRKGLINAETSNEQTAPAAVPPQKHAEDSPVFDQEKMSEGKRLQSAVSDAGFSDDVEVNIRPDQIEIRMNENVLFASAEATLFDEAQVILDTILPAISKTEYDVIIEGHTDNRPISTPRFPSNWELSAARAVSVINYFESQGFPAQRMRAVAYGETKPIDTNNTVEGRQKNRRVQIILE